VLSCNCFTTNNVTLFIFFFVGECPSSFSMYLFFGVYELLVLVGIIGVLTALGRLTHYLSGNVENPRQHEVVQVMKHPSWTPKLRSIRKYFRLLYLVQAPALWLVWLELRGINESFMKEYGSSINLTLATNNVITTLEEDEPFFPTSQPTTSIFLTPFSTMQHHKQHPFWTSPQLAWFVFQFTLYLLWPIIFFRMKRPGWAAMEAMMVWISINYTIRSFWEVNWLAAWLMYPYLSWITTAVGLSIHVWKLNRGLDVAQAVKENAELPQSARKRERLCAESDDEDEEITKAMNHPPPQGFTKRKPNKTNEEERQTHSELK